ncbi:hypothetical protein E2C01_099937 [Portunus trituberculatus]|uniref:Uncharacterized protein n=1 Tax=Portunus trituberculatus TaxID=210409 RepID=A0A5B7KGM8_PORTR|nr:hypothetical protein [Portunus trituberculatus]
MRRRPRDHDSDRPTTTTRPTPFALDFDSTPRLYTPFHKSHEAPYDTYTLLLPF